MASLIQEPDQHVRSTLRNGNNDLVNIKKPISKYGLLIALTTCVSISLVFRSGLAGTIYERSPEVALTIWPNYGPALASIALKREPAELNRTRVDTGKESSDEASKKSADMSQRRKLIYPPDMIRTLAIRALKSDPINVRAIEALGFAAESTGDKEKARKFFNLAFKISKRSIETNVWLLQDAVQRRDFPAAISLVDLFYNLDPQFRGNALSILVALTDNPLTQRFMLAKLKERPFWLNDFVSTYTRQTKDDRNAMRIFLELKASGIVRSMQELRPYFDKLIQEEKIELAYYSWLQLLPPEQLKNLPLIFNGNFEQEVNDAPFNWILSSVSGALSERVPEGDGKQNYFLQISFAGERVQYAHTRQILTLRPGQYRFTARYRLFDLLSARGLVWRLFCGTQSNKPLVESPLMRGNHTNWTSLDMQFSIPKADCNAQILLLASAARNSPESIISGRAQFDDINIVLEKK